MTTDVPANITCAVRLFDSASRFFESAITHAKECEKHDGLSAVLHLGIAFELLMKTRLAMTDLRLLARGKRIPTDDEFLSGDFNSIGPDELLAQLETGGGPHRLDQFRGLSLCV